MQASERREAMLKALHGAFAAREFCVKDIQKRTCEPELNMALTANFAGGWGKLPWSVIAIKIGRLLEQKLTGHKFGPYELVPWHKQQGVNYYRVNGPSHVAPDYALKPAPAPAPRPAPPSRPTMTIEIVGHGTQEALAATAKFERRDEPPVVDKPPVQQTGPPPAWRQPTKQELIERHRQLQTSPSLSRGLQNSITPTPGRFDL